MVLRTMAALGAEDEAALGAEWFGESLDTPKIYFGMFFETAFGLADGFWCARAQRTQCAKRVRRRGLKPEHRRGAGPAARPPRRSATACPCPPSLPREVQANQRSWTATPNQRKTKRHHRFSSPRPITLN